MEEYCESIFDGSTRFIAVYSRGHFHCLDCSAVCESKREKELCANIQRCILIDFFMELLNPFNWF